MKKILRNIFLCILSLLLLVGCGSTNKGQQGTTTYKDGKYKATYDKFDKYGWKGYVEVQVKNSKIDNVDFDYLNKDNKRKSQDKTYNEKMKPVSKTAPNEFCPKLGKDLVNKRDIDKVDNISGATVSTQEFKNLAKAALKNAKKGDQKEVIIQLK
ncbi:FMN-binding protein [Clostridium lundense]|uniref:FMN-binding protein n=1 Tax=Clostridium lundense TaxID=319475 RepID=UPI000687DF3C|nr:FMN-binding protein [Clostridium lundense]